MNFELSEEQSLLKSTLNQYLSQEYGFANRTAASRGDVGFRQDIWHAFAGTLGILGLGTPVDHGGLAGGPVEQMIVMEEAGRALLLEPLAETVFQGAWLLGKCGVHHLDREILQGDVRLAIALGEPEMRSDYQDINLSAELKGSGWRLAGVKSTVVAAPWATHFIIAARTGGQIGDEDGLSLFLVPAETPGLVVNAYPMLDGRRAADLILSDVEVAADALIGPPGEAYALLDGLRDRAIACQAAEAVGLLDRLVQDTIEYAKQRQQFGQPIAAFQALQHRMVDMHMQVELVRSAAILASLNLDAPAQARARAASAAKVTLANACRFVGQNAVQLHGGMGMTDELAIGHYFKRATVLENEFGTAGWHLARHAALETQA